MEFVRLGLICHNFCRHGVEDLRDRQRRRGPSFSCARLHHCRHTTARGSLYIKDSRTKACHDRKHGKQNRSTEGCSKLKKSVDMTSSGKNGLNNRTNASPKWDRARCSEE